MTTDIVRQLGASLGGDYTIEREIVRGGMSRLFVAWQDPPGRRVVVKMLAPELAAELDVERFKREIEALAQLQHPHILPLYSVGEADGAFFFTTPFIDGESLRERLERQGRLPIDEALRLAAEIASALEFSHRKGFVHRDIKPANILLEDDHAVVADFGVARAVRAAANARAGAMTLTGAGVAVGTPAYMSPEQASGEHGDERSDVYALGCLLFEMLAGAPPFSGASPCDAITQRVARDAPRVRQRRDDVPPSVDDLIARMLARDPTLRPVGAELERELELERHTATYSGRPPAAARSPPRRSISRRSALSITAALLVTMLVVAALIVRPFSVGSSPLDSNLVVVAPFGTVAARDSVWQEGLADLFGRAFDGAGPLRTVPVSVALHAWSGRADRASALALARRTGAGLALFGAISPVGADSCHVAATLVDAAAGSVVADHEVTGLGGDHVPRLADSIAVLMLLDVSMRRGVGTVRPAGSIGSSSLPAIKAFLRGDQAFRRAEWDSAQTYYEQAVAQDSTFALAIRQLGRLAVWRRSGIGVGMPRADSAMLAFAQRASRHAHGLGARDSLLVLSDSLTGAVASDFCADEHARGRLLAVTQKLTAQFPTDPEVWVTRGDALFVCGGYYRLNAPNIGKREILQAYDSAIVLDPDLAQAYDKTFRLALDLGDTARVLRYAAKYLTLNPSETSASYLRLITTLLRRPAEAFAVLDTTSGAKVWPAFASLLLYADSAELIVTVGRRLASTTARGGTWDVFPGEYRSVPSAAFRQRPLALALAYRGHLREASALVGPDRGAGFAGGLAGDFAVLGALPQAVADSAFRAWLHERPFRNEPAIASVLAWWGKQRDTAALREYLQLAGAPMRRGGAQYAHRVRVAEGYIALAQGDTESAIRLLASLPSSEWWVHEPLVAARLLVARSRLREAFAVLDRGFPYAYATPLRGLWAIEHARLASRLGQREKAHASYEYVVQLWRAADPELQPYVREARAALAKW